MPLRLKKETNGPRRLGQSKILSPAASIGPCGIRKGICGGIVRVKDRITFDRACCDVLST
jgi:hypothetical protein